MTTSHKGCCYWKRTTVKWFILYMHIKIKNPIHQIAVGCMGRTQRVNESKTQCYISMASQHFITLFLHFFVVSSKFGKMSPDDDLPAAASNISEYRTPDR